MRICDVKECGNKHYSKGYCKKHYYQIKKHDKILIRTMFDINDYNYFDTYFEIILRNKESVEVARTKVSNKHLLSCKEHIWGLQSSGYAGSIINNRYVLLHNFITGNKMTDHKDEDKLNNLDNNLRMCNNSQNNMNRSKSIGVYYDGRCNRWYARIKLNGKSIGLGHFIERDDAIKARHKAEIQYFGEFAPNRGSIKIDIRHHKCVFIYGDKYCGCTSEEPCGQTFETCKNKPRYGGFQTIKLYNGDGEEIKV